MTDPQWQVLEPQARAVMAELTIAAGRPMTHDLRAMCDAVSYVVKNGIEWRALPIDFPPWGAVYAFFERWQARGLAETLVHRLRRKLRVHQGRTAGPSASIVDSQIIKARRHRPQGRQRVSRREENLGQGPAYRRRCPGLAAGPGHHRRQRQ